MNADFISQDKGDILNPYAWSGYCEIFHSQFTDWSFQIEGELFGFFEEDQRSFVTLPGFTQYELTAGALKFFFEKKNVLKAFVLCKTFISDGTSFNGDIFCQEKRGLIGFKGLNSNNFWDDIKGRARKDSRRILLKQVNSKLNCEIVDEPSQINDFVVMYQRLHKAKGMSDVYELKEAKVLKLLRGPNWTLLKIFNEREVFGYVVLARYNDVIDQVFLAYSEAIRDASRFVIYSALDFARDHLQASEYLMGGGIKENDRLEQYKLSLGAARYEATTIKYCSVKAAGYKKNLSLMGARWP